ncbi:MAG: CocE/NonD family hydrolase [Promethearchaeota archaeon]
MNYSKDYTREIGDEKKLFTRNETIYFSVKQVVIVTIGALNITAAAFIAFYSLLMSGNYIGEIGEKQGKKGFGKVGKIVNIAVPLVGVLLFVNTGEIFGIAGLALSLVAFLYYGLKNSSLSLKNLMEKYSLRLFPKFPKSVKLGIFVLLLIIVSFPVALLIGANIYAMPTAQTYMLEMDDGVNLATDVVFAPGSFGSEKPVVYIQTPYGRGNNFMSLLYSLQNYHIVTQDIRGTGDSGGGNKSDFLLYLKSYKDGAKTLDWILEQSWCNGKIATSGASGLSFPEYFLAGMNPSSNLLAQSIMIGTPCMYKIAIFPGAFKEEMTNLWLEGTTPNSFEQEMEILLDHTIKDNFLNSTSLFIPEGPNFKNVNLCAIHVGAWYDVFQQGTLDGYMGYDDLGLDGARGKQLLIMGPNTHGAPHAGRIGELNFPVDNEIKGMDLYMEWEQKLFDYALMGKTMDWSNRVAYYMMGDVDDDSVDANEWRFADDWPVPYENETWYLTAGDWEFGGFSDLSSVIDKNYSYIYDPKNPGGTLGGTNLVIPGGPYDQRSIENRTDVLTFETPVLTEPMDVVGHIWAHLFVKSNCTDTDFTVKITDVYPDNRSMLITDGIINGRRRDGFDKDAPALNSSGVVEVIIDLWSTAYQFNTGHKIRIAVSSSNYPRFAANPNTGAPLKAHSDEYYRYVMANNTILTGPSYPSYITLPIPTIST